MKHTLRERSGLAMYNINVGQYDTIHMYFGLVPTFLKICSRPPVAGGVNGIIETCNMAVSVYCTYI